MRLINGLKQKCPGLTFISLEADHSGLQELQITLSVGTGLSLALRLRQSEQILGPSSSQPLDVSKLLEELRPLLEEINSRVLT